MSPDDLAIIKRILQVSVISTIIGIPVALWAIKRWPNSALLPSLITTGLGFTIRMMMFSASTPVAVAQLTPIDQPQTALV
jgi:hypothetical protein